MIDRSDPVAAAQRMVEGYVGVRRLDEAEARLLGDLVAARLVARSVIAAWRVEDHPENAAYITGGADESWATLRDLDERGFTRSAASCGWPRSRTTSRTSMDREELLSRRQNVLGPSPLLYDEPVHFVDGEGAWLFDPDGDRYLDAYNNVQVVGHPEVAAAVGGQARKLATNTRYLHESVVELGEGLVATLPGDSTPSFRSTPVARRRTSPGGSRKRRPGTTAPSSPTGRTTVSPRPRPRSHRWCGTMASPRSRRDGRSAGRDVRREPADSCGPCCRDG